MGSESEEDFGPEIDPEEVRSAFVQAEEKAAQAQETHLREAQFAGYTREAMHAAGPFYIRAAEISQDLPQVRPIVASGLSFARSIHDELDQAVAGVLLPSDSLKKVTSSVSTFMNSTSASVTVITPGLVDLEPYESPPFFAPDESAVEAALVAVDVSLGDTYREIGQAYHATTADPSRAAIGLMRQTIDHFFEKLAPDDAVRASPDVPVVSLEVGESPFPLGPVQFFPLSESDKTSDWWLHVSPYLGDMADQMLLSYARVNSPGDLFNCVKHAASVVSEALLLLRGIGFPVTHTDIHQIGIINDYPLWQATPFRLGPPKETIRLEFPSPLVTTIGPMRFPYNLHQDILSQISTPRLAALNAILAKNGFSPSREIERKLLNGLRWLGEATKPDAMSARFAKIAFALEALVGGDPSGELLTTTRGITATLAERSAFLAGRSQSERMQIDREVRLLYGKRSGIVHGSSTDIDPEDIPHFGNLVRLVAWGLLDRIPLFGSVNEPQHWILEQRYEMS